MPKYFARAKGDNNISSLPKGTFNYVVIAVVGYWAAIDICRNGNEGKNAKFIFIILQTKFIVCASNFTALAHKEGES